MKLDWIALENFRQYYQRQRLIFSRDSDQNVTVIHGVNGAGKSSLFLAINWCLYGEVVSDARELFSKEAVSRAQEGDAIRVSAELSFIHHDERYLVSRHIVGIKQSDGTVAVNNDGDFTMMRTRWEGQAERINNPIGTMNAILPSNVRTYFLFDAEKIDNFAKPEASEEVRYAIYNVLKLEVLERGRRHLEAVASEYRTELKSISKGELRDLVEEEENKRADKEKKLARKETLKNEIESARRKIAEIDQRLREIQDARNLQQERDRIQRDLGRRQADMDKLISRIRKLAIQGLPAIAQPSVDAALAIIDQKRESGHIPSDIRQDFVQDLINRQCCICGRPFELHSDEHRKLLDLLRDSLPGSLEDDIGTMYHSLRGLVRETPSAQNEINEAMRERIGLQDAIRGLREELDDIRRQLKGSPQEEISTLEKRREEFQADIDSYLLEQGTIDRDVQTLDKELAELERKIGRARKDKERESQLTQKMSLAQRSADAIDEMYQAFADEMRQGIEAKTKEIFKLLIWKGSHFRDICLGTDYKLEVIDRYNQPAKLDLSAGERQVLSLSFITAMSRVSDEEAPLVMDTPFGRLSSGVSISLAMSSQGWRGL